MTRKKGDKDHGIMEKNIIVSLINDYRLFNCSDREMLRLINLKTGDGNGIAWSTFRKLKKKAMESEMITSEWLSHYVRSQIVDHYRTQIKVLEYVERILLDEITKEYSKSENRKPYLINHLAKTLGDISGRLSEMGMSPPIIAKLYSLIPPEILNGTVSKDPLELDKYLKLFHDNLASDSKKAIPKLDNKENVSKSNDDDSGNGINYEIDPLSAETAIPPPIDKENDNRSDGDTEGETATAQGDQPVF
ncbi:MAG: hypothetical protein L0H53_00535 [Candidatus Nitrosocosmicus sp.]|nr:hypothetical protein [Candidatus Nitrosocosmicus sp.]MDN5866023.1 hypothetical protein [Candidatus Nitrosocosmicus sp.]